jgi:hypothetical protein
MKKNAFYLLVSLVAITALMLTGCSGVLQPNSNTNHETSGGTTGRLEVSLTDAPASANITRVEIVVASVEVHTANVTATGSTTSVTSSNTEQEQQQGNNKNKNKQQNQNQNLQTQSASSNSTSTEDEGGWISLDMAASLAKDPATGGSIINNLLDLRDGLQTVLATSNLTAGKYTQIRMEIDRITVYYNNGSGVTHKEAKLPGGKLKFVHPFEIAANQTTQLLFDIDALKSVNFTGNDEIIFKPVIQLTTQETGKFKNVKIDFPRLPDGKINVAYNFALKATGGTPPYTWTANTTLPAGLGFVVTGNETAIKGTPSVSGNFTFTLKVEDSAVPRGGATKEVTLKIAP